MAVGLSRPVFAWFEGGDAHSMTLRIRITYSHALQSRRTQLAMITAGQGTDISLNEGRPSNRTPPRIVFLGWFVCRCSLCRWTGALDRYLAVPGDSVGHGPGVRRSQHEPPQCQDVVTPRAEFPRIHIASEMISRRIAVPAPLWRSSSPRIQEPTASWAVTRHKSTCARAATG